MARCLVRSCKQTSTVTFTIPDGQKFSACDDHEQLAIAERDRAKKAATKKGGK